MVPATGGVSVQITPATGYRFARSWPVRVATAEGGVVYATLSHPAVAIGAVPDWTLSRTDGGGSVRLLAGARIAHDSSWSPDRYSPMVVGLGRNDPTQSRVIEALEGIVATHRDPARRLLILPILNVTSEPAGSPGYLNVTAINAEIEQRWPHLYYDDRAALIAHGLDIAGIAPTSEDTTAITQDRIPPSLMTDGTHLTGPGRLARAVLWHTEITARSW